MKNKIQKKSRSKFERWAREFGILKLAYFIDVNASAPHHWFAGRAMPSIVSTQRILKLAKGKLTIDDLIEGSSKK